MESRNILTTDSGAPVTDNQNSRTAGPAGPVLMEDHHLIEKLAHFARLPADYGRQNRAQSQSRKLFRRS